MLLVRPAKAASKNRAALSAVGARNSVGPPKKSSLKYIPGDSSDSIRRKGEFFNKNGRKFIDHNIVFGQFPLALSNVHLIGL
jgi:hypothetical protein